MIPKEKARADDRLRNATLIMSAHQGSYNVIKGGVAGKVRSDDSFGATESPGRRRHVCRICSGVGQIIAIAFPAD